MAFSKTELLGEYINRISYDILLLSDRFGEVEDARGIFVYLTDKSDVQKLNGIKAICKYQSIDKIYNELAELYAQERNEYTFTGGNDDIACPVIGFTSAAGGTGKTSLSVAYARKLAEQGYQVLYISLESYASLDNFFDEKGDASLSNVLFSLKCKKGNLVAKINNSVRQIYGGIYYIASADNPMEVVEVKKDEWKEFFEAATGTGKYNCVVVDLPDAITDVAHSVMNCIDKIIVVTDGRDISTFKTLRMVDSFGIEDQRNETSLVKKMYAVQNKTVGDVKDVNIPVICSIPMITGLAQEKTIVDAIVSNQDSMGLMRIYVPGGDR